MTTAADRLLVDTNVLVYASLRHSPWHTSAIQAIHSERQTGAELWVSRQILREYLAVLTLVRSVRMGGKQIHDANLVATMQAYGIPRLLTHNVADFVRFGVAITVVPMAAAP